jgi:putative sigma-54 modulation protein
MKKPCRCPQLGGCRRVRHYVDEEALVRLQVKGKNVEVTDSLKDYAVEKLGKLDKHLNAATRLELELQVERNPSIPENQIAEATIWTKGPVLRARESSSDMKASIDQLVDKLERQARRYRDKRRRGQARNNHDQPLVGRPVVADEEAPLIVKTKQFPVKPMTPEEAVLQLELVGHDFFVFQNAETNDVNVVYRRRDNHYGLIEPRVL